MIHTANTSDGSVVIGVDMNISDAEKSVAKLKNKIEQIETQIKKVSIKREEAKQKGLLGQAELDAEKAKLHDLEQSLKEMKAVVKDKSYSQSMRDETKAQISNAEEEVKAQKERVRMLQTEYNKVWNSVDRYDEKLKDLNNDLELQKTAAGSLEMEIAQTEARFKEMAEAAGVADQHIIDLNKELAELKSRQEELEYAGIGFGYKEYDQNAARIAAIMQELKEYKKALVEVSEAEKSVNSDNGKTDRAANAQSRLNTYLEKSSSLYQKLQGMIGKTTEMSSVLQDMAAATTGKMSGMLQATGTALGGFSAALSGAVAAAAPYLAIILAIVSALQKLFKNVNKIAVKVIKIAGNAASAIKDFSLSAISVFASAAERAAEMLKKFNVFSKMADTLSGKFKRLGNTIKSALVFSVIYKGLSLVREQVGKYLSMNAQFMTALRRLQGVLLTAFQPIYDIVVPALTTLINVLARAAATVTQFFASLFGTTAKQAQTNAKNLYEQANATTAAGEAAEDAAKQLADFDEINKLEGTKESGGGGAASVDTGPLFNYEYEETPFDSWGEAFSGFLDKLLAGIPNLRDAFKNFADWLNDLSKKLYDMFTFPGVLDKVKLLGKELADALNDLVNWIEWEQLGHALGAGLNLALNFLTSFIYEFDWINLGRKLAEFVNGLVYEIDWIEFGRLLWAGFKIGLETLAGFILGLDMPQLAEAASNIVIGFFDEMYNTVKRIQWGEIGRQIADFLANLKWGEMMSSVTSAIAAGLMAAVSALRSFLDRIVPELDRIAKEIITELIGFFRDKVDWKEMAQTISDGISAALRFVSGLLDPDLFYEIGAAIGRFFSNIKWGEILDALTTALANGINSAIRAVQGFLDEAAPNIREIAITIGNKINEFVDKINWDELGQVISDGINTALEFIANIMETLDWDKIRDAIDRVLSNIDWDTLMKNVSRVADDAAKSQFELAFSVTDAFQTIGKNIIAGMMQGILDKLSGIGTWIKENIFDPIYNAVCSFFGINSPSTVFAEIGEFLIAGLAQGISDTWHSIVEFFSGKLEELRKFFEDVWGNIVDLASSALEGIQEIWQSVSEWFDENVVQPVRDFFTELWEDISDFASDCWDNIVGVWESVSEWFNDNVVTPVQDFFSSMWEEISTLASDVWTAIQGVWQSASSWFEEHVTDPIGDAFEGMGDFIKNIFNGVISAVEGLINGAIKGINWMISQLNKVSFDIPDWVPAIGGKSFGLSIPSISEVQLPRLAQGAVIPPNREFMAVLGDQKRGNNLEGPESAFEDAVIRGIQRAGVAGGKTEVNISFTGSLSELARILQPAIKVEERRLGTQLTEART